MPRIVSKLVYDFDELNEPAKEKARAWYRNGALDFDWWEYVYDDAVLMGGLIGIEIGTKRGSTSEPAIYFSGFSSQGDGACFEGSYSYVAGGLRSLQRTAPASRTLDGKRVECKGNVELHEVAQKLQEVQRRHAYKLTATVRQRGSYVHSMCTEIEVDHAGGGRVSNEAEQDITDALRGFMDWIYFRLDAEYEFQMSNEQVDASIKANEYEFNEDGSRA